MSFLNIPILQRYVIRDLLMVFFYMLTGVTVLLVFVGVFREISSSGLGPAQAFQILPYIVPSLLPFTIPATMLLTVCVVYGRMAADREIIAAKAAGINVMSLLLPAFAMGGILSLSSLLLADKVIPWAVRNIQDTITQAMEDIFLDVLRTSGQVVDNERGFSITVMQVDGKRLIKPTFHYHPQGSKPVALQAEEAEIHFDMERRVIVLDITDGHLVIPGQRRVKFRRQQQTFPLPFDTIETKPRHMSIRKIRQRLEDGKAEQESLRQFRDATTVMALTLGEFEQLKDPKLFEYENGKREYRKSRTKLLTEIHSRFALSTSCFFFALVGAPFAVQQARRQFLTTFFMCFLPVLLLYYPIALLLLNLAKSQSAPPSVVWLANLLMLIVGLLILRKLLRN